MSLFEFLNLFYPISSSDFELLTKDLKTKKFKKGDYILIPNQIQKELYFIDKGIQMSYFETDDKTHVIAFTYPPNLSAIPESFSFQKPSKYYLKCITDTEAKVLSFDKLQEIFNQSQPIERLFRIMTETVLSGLINRHIELHSQSIEERFKIFCKRSPHLLQMVPHKYIASYLAIDSTNFSKLFNSVKI